jgi:hypothetical protein
MEVEPVIVDVEPEEPVETVETVEPVETEPQETEIESELQEITEKLDQAVERTEVQRCKTKKDYICQIKKLTDKYSDRELVRTKKGDLKCMLAEEFEQSIEKIALPEIELSPDKNKNLVVATMYRLTLGCCTLVESGTKNYSEYLNGYCLHNYALNIDSNPAWKETMMEVLAEIYLENQVMLTELMSKEGRLCAVFMMAGFQSMRTYQSITNGSERRHCNPLEQNSVPRGSKKFRENKPCGSPRLNAR